MQSLAIIAVGDISLQTSTGKPPFHFVKPILAEKDVLFGNLETVLSDKGTPVEKAVILNTSPDKALYLKDAGFDVINVANNHIMDMGPEGLNETLNVLNDNDLSFIGAWTKTFDQSWALIEKKGVKLGFLGYYEGGHKIYENGIFINRINDDIYRDIRNLKSKCDIVIVSLHWGIENVFYPSPKQIKLARNLIDSGSNLVLGHHPHVVQGIERYKNGLIVYSLGNFQFLIDREINKRSIILSVEFNKNRIENYKIIPIKINEDFMPYFMNNQKTQEMLSFIDRISLPIIEGRVNDKWWFEQISREHLIGNMKSWIVRVKKYGIKHLLQFIKWLISPFIIKCYLGLLRRIITKYD